MIRDTSAQDQIVSSAPPAPPAPTGSATAGRRWAPSLLAGIGWAVHAWSNASRSFDSSRVRIAEVKRGDLVRDIAADGRVIAANSPILYAISAGTVDLKVVAGDVVKKARNWRSSTARNCAASWPRNRPPWPAWKPRPAVPRWTPPWPAPSRARKPTRPPSNGRPPTATCSASSAATTAVRCRRSTWPRPRTLKKADITLANATTDARLQSQGADLDARNKRLLADRQKAGGRSAAPGRRTDPARTV
jgi:HlyD family secretion protein